METKRQPIFARRWILGAMIVLLGGLGFVVGYQKHVLWLGILLALVGAAIGWLLWVMIRVAIMTVLGAIVGGVILGLVKGNHWLLGAFLGGCAGFYGGWRLHKRALLPRKSAAPPLEKEKS
jgi:hypothetical protein